MVNAIITEKFKAPIHEKFVSGMIAGKDGINIRGFEIPSPWLKPDGSALSGAVSKVGTDVGDATSYGTITAGTAGITFDAGAFNATNTLRASGSCGSARVGFVLDLTGVATGADVTITESVTYSATCI